MSPHLYMADQELPADHRGQRPCRPPCGLPKANRVHELPERSDDERALEARRLGEED